MKNKYKLNIIFAALFLCVIVFAFSAFNISTNENARINNKPKENKVAGLISAKFNKSSAQNVTLFTENNSYSKADVNNFTKSSKIYKINREAVNNLLSDKPENLSTSLALPDGRNLQLNLVKFDVRSAGYRVRELSNGGIKNAEIKDGVYYQGIIENNERSLVTLSVFENNVMGIISTEEGNYVLGSIKDENKNLTDDYIIYNDNDILKKAGFECGSGDTYSKFYKDPLNNIKGSNNNDATTAPVDIYFVCDYQLYLDGGSNVGTVQNYVTGAFAHVKTLYQNEGLTVNIQGIDVYTSVDPYRNLNESDVILNKFGDLTQNNFQGDLAHLLSTGHGQQLGGIAWINVLCQSYEPSSHSGRYAFSNIEGTYTPYPTYSWTVMVITHETGHNFGSMHTFACVWPTNSGQIDSCVSTGESCVTATRPNNNGTIMSYCHLNGAINLLMGFGELPHDTIVDRYNKALCLDNPLNSSEQPVAYNLLQNYPNPFNPSTNIKFALPDAGLVTLKVYDMAGREVAELINSQHYPVGIFSYTLDATLLNLASGVYIYKLDVTKDNNMVYSQIKKMVLVK